MVRHFPDHPRLDHPKPDHPEQAVWQAFEHAAGGYDEASFLQRQSADYLLHLMMKSGLHTAGQWLDAGAGTGWLARQLVQLGLHIHAVDQSAAMLERLQSVPGIVPCVADVRHLPFADAAMDGLVSHFVLHWPGPDVLPELVRVVRDGGTVWLAIPVAGSFAMVRRQYPGLPVFDFQPAALWLDAVKQCPDVTLIHSHEREWQQHFRHLRELLHTLRRMGGHRLNAAHDPVDPARFRTWLKAQQPVALEYRVLYVQLRVQRA